MTKWRLMTSWELWIPVHQSQPSPTLPWYWWQRLLDIDAPSSRWYWASRHHILGVFVPSYTVVCVCARHIVKRRNYPQCSCVFREQFLLPLALVLFFPENSFFQHFTEKKVWYSCNSHCFCLVKSPPHGSRLLRWTDTNRYCVFSKWTSVEIRACLANLRIVRATTVIVCVVSTFAG